MRVGAMVVLASICAAEEVEVTPSGEIVRRAAEEEELTPSASLLKELFPPSGLKEAWEKHPMLASSRPVEGDIPVIRRDREAKGPFSLMNLEEVFRHPMVHGEDYKIAKKVVRDGEEWTGTLPRPPPSFEHAMHLVFQKGFSLILNELQSRWGAVAEFARRLEWETGCTRVSCNLYLTPAVPLGEEERRGGFEAHFDWMDVVVVQVEGEKVWSVGGSPMVALPLQDMKRKPKAQELLAYTQRRFQEFVLRPGDALFIPRGFVHNASTAPAGDSQNPSLHLTFGLEPSINTLVVLLHHSLNLYSNHVTHTDSPALLHRIAVRKTNCERSPDHVRWLKLLHFAIAALARRRECGYDEHADACALRASLPVDPPTAAREYRNALDLLAREADAAEAVALIAKLESDREMRQTFKYPGGDATDLIRCSAMAARLNPQTFKKALREFIAFAMDRFDAALSEMEAQLQNSRASNLKTENAKLNAVGQ